MNKPKIALLIGVLLSFAVAGGWVWNAQKATPANVQKGSVARVDTSNWPTHQIEKLGLSVKMPPVYKQSSLAQEHNVDGYFSTWNDEDTRDYEKHRFDYNGNDGEVLEPSFIIINKLNIFPQDMADLVHSDYKQDKAIQIAKYGRVYYQLKRFTVAGHEAIIAENTESGDPHYFGGVKLTDGILEVRYTLGNTYVPTFEEFEAMVRSINF